MKLGFLGFGSMAQAMAQGLILSQALPPEEIGANALHLDKLEANCRRFGIRAFSSAEALVSSCDYIVAAVKPYQLDELLPPLLPLLRDKALISVAAGKGCADIESLLPGTRHLSTVPNLAVAAAKGIIVCEDLHSLAPEDLKFLNETFGRMALLEFVPSLCLNIAGTLAGCGPAYAAMFAEALADAGVKHGLSRASAKRLAAGMLAGTGELLQGTYEPAELKDGVCSPGGTTIAGVAALEKAGFRGAVIAAIDAVEAKSH